ncbi:hypothetical protein IF1G_09370 [Cordyceps javanica]|uniref:Uncharacterized protein n=1 Tax=Cordyceps javanica TaxID=43265 RepID=A0A545UQP3_9HYPO|nr:hypothetical protein IF1G_09370 [Cordyceps javanica]
MFNYSPSCILVFFYHVQQHRYSDSFETRPHALQIAFTEIIDPAASLNHTPTRSYPYLASDCIVLYISKLSATPHSFETQSASRGLTRGAIDIEPTTLPPARRDYIRRLPTNLISPPVKCSRARALPRQINTFLPTRQRLFTSQTCPAITIFFPWLMSYQPLH